MAIQPWRLGFEPEHDLSDAIDMPELTLAKLAAANQTILSGQDSDILASLSLLAAPLRALDQKRWFYMMRQVIFITTDLTRANPPATPWLIKFPAQSEHKSVCLLEALYADMAKQAGLNMPAHHYFDINNDYAAFGVERF